MNTNEVNMSGEGMLVARSMSRASLSFGLLLAVLGTFCVLAPLFTGIAVTTLIGVLFLAGGIAQVIHAFQSESFGKGVLRFLVGGLTAVAAVVILMKPGEGLSVLTMLLAAYFLAGGVVDIVLSFKVPFGEGKGWMLFGGIMTIALAVFIIAGWPITGIWAVGVFVGVRLILHGMTLMAMGEAGKQALTQLQDTRIAVLEQHLRSGAEALQQTQVALADHAAMILALDNKLRKKVSSSDVDPAIVELNKSLSEARGHMKKAAAAAKADWAKTQDQANAAFGMLQQSTSNISSKLKAELGLEKADASSTDSKK